MPTIVFSDVSWVMDRQDKHKLFDLVFHRLTAVIDRDDRILRFDVDALITAMRNQVSQGSQAG